MTAESSPLTVPQTTSSAESNFRELDDAYLQTQARIWLGEVLQIRFDEHVDISDLLADGELLFEVSEVISRMLPTLSVDETLFKVHEWKTLSSNKSAQRYMPYYNVDSFLRMCKNLGMDGIDLFTPSDVVERRSTRKVCMCLRSLSMLSRLRDLNVPDFDSVTCTLAMPTDMVECIRKSLEKSQSSSSLSVEQEAEKATRVRFWQRISDLASAVSNGYSGNCDEAESRFVVAESHGSPDFAFDAESSDITGSLARGHNSAPQLNMSLGFSDEEDDDCEYLSPSKAESVGSPCSQYYSDEELSTASSNCLGSRVSGKVPELNSDRKKGCLVSDASHIPIDWGNSHLDVGNCEEANTNDDEVGCVSRDIDVDTTCAHEFYPTHNEMCNEYLATLNNPAGVDCDKSIGLAAPPETVVTDDVHVGDCPISSHEDAPLNNIEAKYELLVCEVGPNNDEPYSHEESNAEILSAEQIIHTFLVSKLLEKPDSLYDDENQVLNACTEVINVGQNSFCDKLNSVRTISEDLGDKLRLEEQPPCSIDYNGHYCNCSRVLDVGLNGNDDYMDGKENELLDMHCIDLYSSLDMVISKNNIKCSKDCHDATELSQSCNDLVGSVDDKSIDVDNTIPVSSIAKTHFDSRPQAQIPNIVEDTDHKELHFVKDVDMGDSAHVKEEAINKETPLHKPQRKLLKSFVKGTALLGVAIFFLHLRKNRKDNNSKEKKRPTHTVIQGMPKPLQKGSITGSVYPAEKLRLGR